MTKIPFETFKSQLIADLQNASDYDSLEDKLLDAQMEMDTTAEPEDNEELLVKILKISHRQVVEGRTYTQEEVERFLDQRMYEFGSKVVGTSVAESF